MTAMLLPVCKSLQTVLILQAFNQLHRYRHNEKKLRQMLWRIDTSEIVAGANNSTSAVSSRSLFSVI